MKVKFSIGADPEIFVGDNNGPRSVIGKIGGTKHQPMPLPIGKGFAVQEDNVALEFNIPASKSKAAFVKNITKATGFLSKVIHDMHGLQFLKQSAISFPEEEMYDPKAFEFGCEPDYNAWTRTVNPRPKANDPLLRSVGGHIHVGVDGIDPETAVKCMDLTLAVPAQFMDDGNLRKQLYGKVGAFRKTAYGFEYRPLSNFWIFNPITIEWAYNNTKRALELATTGFDIDSLREEILEAVDNNNVNVAQELVNKYNLEVVYA